MTRRSASIRRRPAACQGDTVDIGLTIVTPATSHRSLYVGATRGRNENQLLVVADDDENARDVLEQVLTNDRADIPAIVRRRELLEQANDQPTSTEGAGSVGPSPRLTPEPPVQDRLDTATKAREKALLVARPHLNRLGQAQDALDNAEQELKQLRNEAKASGRVHRLRLREPIRQAEANIQRLRSPRDAAAAHAEPYQQGLNRADRAVDDAERALRVERATQRLDAVQHCGPERLSPGRGLGIG